MYCEGTKSYLVNKTLIAAPAIKAIVREVTKKQNKSVKSDPPFE